MLQFMGSQRVRHDSLNNRTTLSIKHSGEGISVKTISKQMPKKCLSFPEENTDTSHNSVPDLHSRFSACPKLDLLLLLLLSCFSRVGLFTTPWTAAHQAPLSMEFSRQEY